MNTNQTPPQKTLMQVTAHAESAVYFLSILMHIGSAILTGGSVYIYLHGQSTGFVGALLLSILIGAMTMAALATFTTAAVKIVPRLNARYLPASLLMIASAIFAVLVVSGTSNATFLAYKEAQILSFESHRQKAEAAFTDVQNSVRALEQILPILQTGRDTARALRTHEKQNGLTGGGKGPVYAELLLQETRLNATADSLKRYTENTAQDIRRGERILEALRKSLKDESLSTEDKRRALENALTRLSGLVIALRRKMPLTSLQAVATMLRAPVRLSDYSDTENKRRSQEGIARRLHAELAPIGTALREALDKLQARTIKPVPLYQHQSPTAMVFAHAGDLFWILAVGYAIDILPYITLGLVLLGYRQTEEDAIISAEDAEEPSPPVALVKKATRPRRKPASGNKKLLSDQRGNRRTS